MPTNDDRYVDLRTLARVLPFSIRTLRNFTRDAIDPLPAIKARGKLIFRWRDVEAWLSRRQVQPVDVDAIACEVLGEGTRHRTPRAGGSR